MANSNLTNAKLARNDVFYTQYFDIEKDINEKRSTNLFLLCNT